MTLNVAWYHQVYADFHDCFYEPACQMCTFCLYLYPTVHPNFFIPYPNSQSRAGFSPAQDVDRAGGRVLAAVDIEGGARRPTRRLSAKSLRDISPNQFSSVSSQLQAGISILTRMSTKHETEPDICF